MRLIDYLRKNHISVTEFAELSGVQRNSIYRVINGSQPYTDNLRRIVAATNGQVSIEELKKDYGKFKRPAQPGPISEEGTRYAAEHLRGLAQWEADRDKMQGELAHIEQGLR